MIIVDVSVCGFVQPLLTNHHTLQMCGHHGVCKALIQAGADVNMKNKNATTPLHLAARNGYVECCKACPPSGPRKCTSVIITNVA